MTAAKIEAQDKATEQLARRYAALIDDAQPLAKYAKHLAEVGRALAVLERLDPDTAGDAADSFDKIADALSAHSVASDLGPKLLAALTALGMTPTARRAVMGGQSAPTPTGPGDELRERRRTRAARARQSDAATVDPATP